MQHENIFLEKSGSKFGGETIHRPFSKKSKLSISLDQQFKVLVCFYSMPNLVSKYIETKCKYLKTKFQTTCFYLV